MAEITESEERALTDTSLGHRWSLTLLKGAFPAVCVRCMKRSDNPTAVEPCDAVSEKVRERETQS